MSTAAQFNANHQNSGVGQIWVRSVERKRFRFSGWTSKMGSFGKIALPPQERD
jgi:hypothetical protein